MLRSAVKRILQKRQKKGSKRQFEPAVSSKRGIILQNPHVAAHSMQKALGSYRTNILIPLACFAEYRNPAGQGKSLS
jgi:hypothetical protein